MVKICSNCTLSKPLEMFSSFKRAPDGKHYWCKECVKSYNKSYKKTARGRAATQRCNAKYEASKKGKETRLKSAIKRRENYPEKTRAQRRAQYKIKTVEPCEQCGSSGRTVRHHDDYTKPLDIRWLCHPCHYEWHKNNEPLGVNL